MNINSSSSLHRLKVNYINLEERGKKTNLKITESDICILFSPHLNKCIIFFITYLVYLLEKIRIGLRIMVALTSK